MNHIPKKYSQEFQIKYSYDVHFTKNVFSAENTLLGEIFASSGNEAKKILVLVDDGLAQAQPNLTLSIQKYFKTILPHLGLTKLMLVQGGEHVKNDQNLLMSILDEVNIHGIDRHSYILAIGGGAVLDFCGLAAAVAHRGVRLIRIPSTVLAQNDSGIGVKNSINAFGKKNFLGTFAPPYAVVNDFELLKSLSDRDWIAGISEAIKVALIKDKIFFEYIKSNALALKNRDQEVMKYLIFKCAELHLQHIAGGDPFEQGSSRPLDFGHWSAHKLEQITNYKVRHGEAVAIGIALDVTYSMLKGFISEEECAEIISVLTNCGFSVFHPFVKEYLDQPEHPCCILSGLNEFREHLGGKLTIMLLDKIGKGMEVHEIDQVLMQKAILKLEKEVIKISE